MPNPPAVDTNRIREWLATWWSIRPVQLGFVGEGRCSWGYVVEDEYARRWFFKVAPDGVCKDALDEFALRAAHSLHRDCGLGEVVAPEMTDSFGWVAPVGDYRAALFPYVHGALASETELTGEQQFIVGELIGRLHRARPRLDCYPRRERFLAQDLRPLLRRLNDYRDREPFVVRTALLLHNLRQPLLELAEALDEVQHRVVMNETLADTFVICHGAPIADNILLREDGAIALIDWDMCLYAPKERDLIALAAWPAALDGYLSIVGDFSIQQDVIHFYQLQRDCGDLLHLATRIFSPLADDAQRERDFGALVARLKGLGL